MILTINHFAVSLPDLDETMNKTSFLFLALLLIACTPQVTVTSEVTITLTPPPTQTPIPTPNLHPQFIELQTFIASSARFTLLPDGTIEEQTVDGGRQTVPNLHVDQNGVINIIFNNEHVLIETSQISFDDENGLTINGYELNETGEWVEANMAQEMVADILSQYSVEPENVTISEVDGIITVTDNETGNVLFETDGDQTKFSLVFAADTIAATSCEPTDFKPAKHNGLLPGASADVLAEYAKYFDIVINDSGVPRWSGIKLQYFLIDREQQCWGIFRQTNKEDANKDKVIVYHDEKGVAQVIPLLDAITWDEIYAFAGDR
jgi:hypothetical protein